MFQSELFRIFINFVNNGGLRVPPGNFQKKIANVAIRVVLELYFVNKGAVVSLHVVKDGGVPHPLQILDNALANDRNIPHPVIYQLNNTFCLRSSMY